MIWGIFASAFGLQSLSFCSISGLRTFLGFCFFFPSVLLILGYRPKTLSVSQSAFQFLSQKIGVGNFIVGLQKPIDN